MRMKWNQSFGQFVCLSVSQSVYWSKAFSQMKIKKMKKIKISYSFKNIKSQQLWQAFMLIFADFQVKGLIRCKSTKSTFKLIEGII